MTKLETSRILGEIMRQTCDMRLKIDGLEIDKDQREKICSQLKNVQDRLWCAKQKLLKSEGGES